MATYSADGDKTQGPAVNFELFFFPLTAHFKMWESQILILTLPDGNSSLFLISGLTRSDLFFFRKATFWNMGQVTENPDILGHIT